jgi:hypothetical protein
MKSLDLDSRVVCFADSNPKKHGTQWCGRDVRSVDFIRMHPDYVIIVSSGYYGSILESIRDAGCVNPVYAYISSDPQYGVDEKFVNDLKRIEACYDPEDEYTKMIIKALLITRDPLNYPYRIQPIDNIKCLEQISSYWYDERTTLSKYDALTIFDAGAYDGDTMKQLFDYYGDKIKKYYAFEPDNVVFKRLIDRLSQMNLQDPIPSHAFRHRRQKRSVEIQHKRS